MMLKEVLNSSEKYLLIWAMFLYPSGLIYENCWQISRNMEDDYTEADIILQSSENGDEKHLKRQT